MLDDQNSQSIASDPHLRCPKCLVKLDQIEFHDIPIERCPECQGIWLDAGELELIYQRERSKDSWLSKLFKKVAEKQSEQQPAEQVADVER